MPNDATTPGAVSWDLKDVARAVALLVFVLLPGFVAGLLPFSRSQLASSLHPLTASFVMLVMEGTLIFLAWFFGIRPYKTSINELGFTAFNVWRSLLLGALWLFAIKVFTVVYGVVAANMFGLNPPPEVVRGIPDLFGPGALGFVLALLIVAIVAPVAEEAFFRGFIYPALRKRFGIWTAIMGSSVVFALFHAKVWLFIPVTIMGMVLAHLYESEDSLGPPIVLHSLNNLLSLIIIYAQKGG